VLNPSLLKGQPAAGDIAYCERDQAKDEEVADVIGAAVEDA
jgi:hypothetical protein